MLAIVSAARRAFLYLDLMMTGCIKNREATQTGKGILK
jgi:hypothetical protein